MGSSPLARGLHPRGRRAGRARGIIPARAGFTDHARRLPGRLAGSSPLARGLLTTSGGYQVGSLDHPRSRGVYSASPSTPSATSGSSPLARGLLARMGGGARGPRIIPARAGFTGGPAGRTRARRDHPRSRGVYRSWPGWGSRTSWIIPARAGFTMTFSRSRSPRSDHPRSRGVYRRVRSSRSVAQGSSPLARGLPGPPGPRGSPGRIIPARAGFTSAGRPAGCGAWDHPRSRGVYHEWVGSQCQDFGSSPLARGLPRVVPRACVGRRIIPARAGFTQGPAAHKATGPDHPRSRGVYARPCVRR